MSFIIKKFLRKLIEQYLNIYDQLNLQKGELQLPSGHLNQTNINKILKSKNIPCMIAYSEYTNLGISIPIIEILSKPIVIKMECLRVVVVVESGGEEVQVKEKKEEEKPAQDSMNEKITSPNKNKEKKTSKSQNEQQSSSESIASEPSTKSQKSYFKSIITRLLTNMQIEIKKLQIIVRYGNTRIRTQSIYQELDNNQYKLTLQNFIAKNSLSLLQANILKKIVCMSKLSVTVNQINQDEQLIMQEQQKISGKSKGITTTIAQVSDLNMCINIDYTRVTMICLLDKLIIGVECRLLFWVVQKIKQRQLATKQPDRNIKDKTRGQRKVGEQQTTSIQPDLQAIQLKINEIRFSILDKPSRIVSGRKNTPNIQLYTLSLHCLQISKQKVKKIHELNPVTNKQTTQKISQLTLHLQSILLTAANDNQNTIQKILHIKMCQKLNKTENSTIQGWNKNKRKQFKVCLEVADHGVLSVHVSDVDFGLFVSNGIVANGDKILRLARKHLGEFMTIQDKQKQLQMIKQGSEEKYKIEQQSNNNNKKQGKKSDSILPQISLNNIKLSVTVEPELDKARFSLTTHFAQNIKLFNKISHSQQTELKCWRNEKILQINQLNIIINNKCQILKISNVKFCHSQKFQSDQKQEEEIVVSVHEIGSNLDVFVVNQVLGFLNASGFKGLCDRLETLISEGKEIGLMLQQRSKKDKISNSHPKRMIKQELKMSQQKDEKSETEKRTKFSQQKSPQQALVSQSNEKHLYLRINSLTFSIGSYHNIRSPSAVTSKFNPIIIIEFQSIKALLIVHQSEILKMNAKITLKTICAISPHNLSHSILLKSPIRVKLYHNQLNKNQQEGSKNTEFNTNIKKDKIRLNLQEGNNYGVSILDPFYLDIQEQHILLISSVVKNIVTNNKSNSSFTTISNNTNQPVKIVQNINNNPQGRSFSPNNSSKQMNMQQQKKYAPNSSETINNMLTGCHEVMPNCVEEIYLFQLAIRVCINGEYSEVITLGLDGCGDITTTTSIVDQENNNTLVQKSTTLIEQKQPQPQQPDPQATVKSKTSQISSQKTIKQPTSTASSCAGGQKYKIEKGIMFPYHEQCKYILEIDYSNGYLLLNVKYKYELCLFQGVEQYCGLKSLEVRCIKFDKYEKYVNQHNNKQNIMSLSWELLEQDKIQHITILIETLQQTQQYRLSRLMTNSLKYRLYGLYQSQCQSQPPAYHYYILQPSQIPTLHHHNQADTSTHRYYLMPYLILINNLSQHSISLNITNKKSLLNQQYFIQNSKQCIPIHEGFDYYMKQYMIKLVLNDFNANSTDTEVGGEIEKYESQEHYFNTFFMVDQAFQNVIQLRSIKSNTRRYIRIRQSFIHKTKILQIQDCLKIHNKTDYNLQLTIMPRGSTSKPNKPTQNNGIYKINKNTITNYPNKIKKDDKLKITYLMSDNSIQVPVGKLVENNNQLLLSYNFCKLENSVEEEYYQILIKMEIKAISHNTDSLTYNSSNLQIELIFSQFIVFTNVCSRGRDIKLNGRILRTSYDRQYISDGNNSKQSGDLRMSLCLPSNTNKDYNNKYMGIDMEKIYDDLLVNNRNWIMQGNSNYMQIELLPLSKQKPKDTTSEQQLNPSILYLHQLISHKIIQHNKTVYSLVKSLKDDRIELFFGDHLFSSNVPLKYFIFNNCTQQYFLMNSTETQYAKYLLFPNQMEDQGRMKGQKRKSVESGFGEIGRSLVKKQQRIFQFDIKSQQHKKQPRDPHDQKQEQPVSKKQSQQFNSNPQVPNSKIHIQGKHPYPLNIMLNKQKHDIFLCDSQYRKLEPLTFRKLQKLKIKQQKYQIQNFTIIDLENQSKYNEGLQNPEYSFSTQNVTVRISSKRRNLALIAQIKSINIRTFQNDKIDFLVQDVSIGVTAQQQIKSPQQSSQTTQTVPTNIPQSNKPNIQIYQILRIPEQSYLLVEGKMYEDKIVLIRNIYMKCKIIDLHVNKEILGVVSYFAKLTKYVGEYLSGNQKSITPDSTPETIAKKSQISKIINLSKEKILLIRSLCIHPINLCLSVQTNPSMDFSNMITLPEFTISSKVYRMSSLIKEVSNHYLTNIIAKFPKLSFIYQNLRSPIAMVKSILQARTILAGSDQEKNVLMWGLAYVQLEKRYFGVGVDRSFEKRLLSYIVANSKKNDRQLDKVNQFLLELTLQSPNPSSNTGPNKQSSANKQIFICPLKNIVSTNITKLAQTINIPVSYYLTNKYIRVISPASATNASNISQYVPIKEIESIKITRFNNNNTNVSSNAELVINFKRRGIYMKIVDDVLVCYALVNCVNSILM